MLQKKIKTQETLPHDGMPPLDTSGPAISFFEFWPRWIFYPPVGLYMMWQSLRHMSPTAFTASNPLIPTGGFVDDSKHKTFSLFGDYAEKFLPKTIQIENCSDFDALKQKITDKNILYPLVVKPDMACRGAGVQKIHNDNELRNYYDNFPETDALIIQELIDYEGEAGIFYIRHPDQDKGHIFSVTLKYFPYVYGDGVSSLKNLINRDDRASKLSHIYIPRHKENLEMILKKDEPYRLSFAGAHSKGTIFKNGNHLINEKMSLLFDTISKDINEFYFGRFDVRFKDIASLETGENLKIIELNGAGAEATHIWDSKTRLTDAYKTLFTQFKHAYEIGHKNKKRGYKSTPLFKLIKHMFAHEGRDKEYPPTH